jgi:hypothetical protein
MADGRQGLDGCFLLPPNHRSDSPSFHAFTCLGALAVGSAADSIVQFGRTGPDFQPPSPNGLCALAYARGPVATTGRQPALTQSLSPRLDHSGRWEHASRRFLFFARVNGGRQSWMGERLASRQKDNERRVTHRRLHMGGRGRGRKGSETASVIPRLPSSSTVGCAFQTTVPPVCPFRACLPRICTSSGTVTPCSVDHRFAILRIQPLLPLASSVRGIHTPHASRFRHLSTLEGLAASRPLTSFLTLLAPGPFTPSFLSVNPKPLAETDTAAD